MFKHLYANCSSVGVPVIFYSFRLNKKDDVPCLTRSVHTPWKSTSSGGQEVIQSQEKNFWILFQYIKERKGHMYRQGAQIST